jgi:hypothetical protein
MSLFPETIQQVLKGRTVRHANLITLDFVSAPMHLWTGNGMLYHAGETWAGTGQLGYISGLQQAADGSAPEAQFTLSGLDAAVLAIAQDDFEAEARDQLVTVFIQFFGPDDDVPLDAPYPLWTGKMQRASIAFDADGKREVKVDAESLFGLRSRPTFAMYTDRDQDRRFAGDRGFEFVAGLTNKVVTWPDF